MAGTAAERVAAQAAKALEAQAKAQAQAEALYADAIAEQAEAQAQVDTARERLAKAREVTKALRENFPALKRLDKREGSVNVARKAKATEPDLPEDLREKLASVLTDKGMRSCVKAYRAGYAGKPLAEAGAKWTEQRRPVYTACFERGVADKASA